MTRGLHTATKVQRGDSRNASAAERRRGYEPSDAPPKGVGWVTAAFIGLMMTGLLFAVPVVLLIDRGLPPAEPAKSDPQPPAPRLLVHPQVERGQIEAAQAARLARGPVGIDEAMRRVAEVGWRDDAPAPGAEQAARDHVEALQ